ncbi:hypothetical protein ACRRTK_021538 [Alexandromys fortis]
MSPVFEFSSLKMMQNDHVGPLRKHQYANKHKSSSELAFFGSFWSEGRLLTVSNILPGLVLAS